MKKYMKIFIAISKTFKRVLPLGVIFFGLSGFAGTGNDLFTSVRGLGMGGAYTAIVNGSDALYYNPASLARVSGVYWTIGDPRVGISNLETLTTLTDLQTDGGLADTLSGLYGEPVFTNIGGKTAFLAPYFGVMYYSHVNASLALSSPVYPEFDVDYTSDLGIGVGFAFPIVPGALYTGFNIKRFERTGGRKTISGDVLGNLDSDELTSGFDDKGLAYSLDWAFNLTFPSPMVTPTFALVWKNVGRTTFSDLNGTAPAPDEEEMILGMGIELDATLVGLTGSLELRKLNDASVQLTNKLYLGVELAIPFIDVRAGFGQGYYSLGAGVGMGLVQIDLATYGVELGEYPGQLEDRRYIASITVEIGVGGFGIFGDGDGGDGFGSARARRNLKQRR